MSRKSARRTTQTSLACVAAPLHWIRTHSMFLVCILLLLSVSLDQSTLALALGPLPQPDMSPTPIAPPPAFTPVDTPDSALQKLQDSKVPLTIAFAGLALYSLIGLLTLVAMIFPPQRIAVTRQSQVVQRIFSGLVLVFCVLRVIYFCFPIAHVDLNVTYVVNQVSFLVFFTMFSLIIFFWAEQYHRKFYDTQSMLPRLRNVFIAVNVILWIIEIILVGLSVGLGQVPKDRIGSDTPPPFVPAEPGAPSSVAPIVTASLLTPASPSAASWVPKTPAELTAKSPVRLPSKDGSALSSSSSSYASDSFDDFFATPTGPPLLTPSSSTKGAGVGGWVYFMSVILVIVIDFVFAVGFLIYGIALVVQKSKHSLGSNLRRELIQTVVVTIVFAACFVLRMVMFLYRPITGKYMNATVYRVLAYFVPEVTAVLLQVFVVYLMNHGTGGGSYGGWKRAPRRTGSVQRPSVDDDIYSAADHDLRASAMPAPIANAHQRLISPPRPLRTNFSLGSSLSTSASIASQASPKATPPTSTSSNPANNTTNSTTTTSSGPPSQNSSSQNNSTDTKTNNNSQLQSSQSTNTKTATTTATNTTSAAATTTIPNNNSNNNTNNHPYPAIRSPYASTPPVGMGAIAGPTAHPQPTSRLASPPISPGSFSPTNFTPLHEHSLRSPHSPHHLHLQHSLLSLPPLPLQSNEDESGEESDSLEIDPTESESLISHVKRSKR